MKVEGLLVGIQAEVALKKEYAAQRVLRGEISVSSFSILDQTGRDSIPAILALSPGAAAAYKADPFTFERYTVLENDGFIFLSETGIDALAILRPAGEGKIEVQGKKANEWLTVDLNQGQKLGLAIITGNEGKNSMARFWAKAFVFNKE